MWCMIVLYFVDILLILKIVQIGGYIISQRIINNYVGIKHFVILFIECGRC